jgi:hypothetical protein
MPPIDGRFTTLDHLISLGYDHQKLFRGSDWISPPNYLNAML